MYIRNPFAFWYDGVVEGGDQIQPMREGLPRRPNINMDSSVLNNHLKDILGEWVKQIKDCL